MIPRTAQQPVKTTAKSSDVVDVVLESSATVARNADIEIERHKAVSDIVANAQFRVLSDTAAGPYKLMLGLQDGMLTIRTLCLQTGARDHFSVALASLAPLMTNYMILCENFYKTARAGLIYKLESIDTARKALHDAAADIITDALNGKVILDKSTARRLFSLLYVLHMRNPQH